MLETYVPAQAIRRPVRPWGRAWRSPASGMPSRSPPHADRPLPARGAGHPGDDQRQVGPLGAANDPGGLNANWTAGVGAYYAALGGDPRGRSAPAARTPARPAPPPRRPSSPPEPSGPPVVTAWGGAVPRGEGVPAVIEGFVFPLALPQGAPALYGRTLLPRAGAGGLRRSPAPVRGHDRDLPRRARSGRGRRDPARCSDRVRARGGEHRLLGGDAGGDGLGYGPLVSYAPGVARREGRRRTAPGTTRAC